MAKTMSKAAQVAPGSARPWPAMSTAVPCAGDRDLPSGQFHDHGGQDVDFLAYGMPPLSACGVSDTSDVQTLGHVLQIIVMGDACLINAAGLMGSRTMASITPACARPSAASRPRRTDRPPGLGQPCHAHLLDGDNVKRGQRAQRRPCAHQAPPVASRPCNGLASGKDVGIGALLGDQFRADPRGITRRIAVPRLGCRHARSTASRPRSWCHWPARRVVNLRWPRCRAAFVACAQVTPSYL